LNARPAGPEVGPGRAALQCVSVTVVAARSCRVRERPLLSAVIRVTLGQEPVGPRTAAVRGFHRGSCLGRRGPAVRSGSRLAPYLAGPGGAPLLGVRRCGPVLVLALAGSLFTALVGGPACLRFSWFVDLHRRWRAAWPGPSGRAVGRSAGRPPPCTGRTKPAELIRVYWQPLPRTPTSHSLERLCPEAGGLRVGEPVVCWAIRASTVLRG